MQIEWALAAPAQHPAMNGPLAFDLRTDESTGDAIIEWAEPRIAPLHRGVEKLFESRDYRQALMLADRHDWHSAFGSELGLALTLEAQLGITVPPRATWIRTLLAELNRAIHHLRWLGESVTAFETAQGIHPGPEHRELRERARLTRDTLIDTLEAISGGRLHPMVVTPGGLRADAPEGWTALAEQASVAAADVADALQAWADNSTAGTGIGVLSHDLASTFAVSGPAARASGLAIDLRFDEPYCGYQELVDAGTITRVTATAGDARARMQVLAAEVAESLAAIAHCAAAADQYAGEPVSVRLPKTLRIPEGTGYGWTENPTGINGWYLVSRGAAEPYRLKIRSASFANAQALSHALVGTKVRDLPITVMSFLLVTGDLAK
ncbi:MAG: NADH-quinone oxidoreductase subunit D [Actinomycetes bacterium]